MKNRDVIIVAVCICTAIICIALTFWGNYKNNGVLTADSFIGVCTALIGACATIIVGSQIASYFEIHETKKQMQTITAERDRIQNDIKQVRTYLSNISVLTSGISENKIIRSLADITSIVCDTPRSDNAVVTLNRYKSLLNNIKEASDAEKKELSRQVDQLKNINIPTNIKHYVEIAKLHINIIEILEKAATTF